MSKHPLFKKLNLKDHFQKIIIITLIIAVIGGRLLYIMEQPEMPSLSDALALWEGGFSVLGSISAVVLILPLYILKLNIPLLPFLDLIALHAPLLQSIARVGCFLAGCCYGKPTNSPIGFVYTDHESIAPLYQSLHPTQLYSAVALMIIFALLYFVIQKITSRPGQLFGTYLVLVGLERFVIDFFRDSPTRLPGMLHFSVTQALSAAIFISGLCVIGWTSLRLNRNTSGL
jgi:phosphatidylglycerol:prolipoprotein diacylglycerol transferase